MLALCRIPLLLAATVGIHVSITAPNPSPVSERRVVRSKREWLAVQSHHIAVIFGKSVLWAAAVSEIAVIVANHNPSSPYSQIVYRSLVSFPTERAERIKTTPLFILGSLLSAVGGLIRHWCYRSLRHMFTFEIGVQEQHHLVTTGPYSYVRHPSYTALQLVFLGIILCHLTRGSYVYECGPLDTVPGRLSALGLIAVSLSNFPFVIKRAPVEDEMLRNEFGSKWEEWADTVKWRFIPGVW